MKLYAILLPIIGLFYTDFQLLWQGGKGQYIGGPCREVVYHFTDSSVNLYVKCDTILFMKSHKIIKYKRMSETRCKYITDTNQMFDLNGSDLGIYRMEGNNSFVLVRSAHNLREMVKKRETIWRRTTENY